jgi:8-oxo-dGTP pyrophosphatase MutT (NUDIX family)
MGLIDQTWYEKPAGIRERQSAGGVVIRYEFGQPLVALTREGPYSVYILPKGHIEPGETPELAARREIHEEAGLSRLELVRFLGIRSRLDFRKRFWVHVHYFLFKTTQIEGRPTDAKHGYTCEWFSLDALPEMFWPEQGELLASLLTRDFTGGDIA